MKKIRPFLLLTTLFSLALAACSTAAAASGPSGAPVQAETETCPVTQLPSEPFVPPKPWPETFPYAGQAWYGDAGLWTTIPENGEWAQLARGEKSWWWSEEFDVEADTTPDLVVTARRLDGKAANFHNDGATNGYHESFNWAMLTGVDLDSPGCWEITGSFRGHTLSFVVRVPGE
jgi:hypothetical protein